VPSAAAHLRLAIVTPRFWPLVGDSDTHLLQLAESLISLGHKPTIITPRWKRSWPEQMTVGTAPLTRLRGSHRDGWSTLRWMYSLASWLRARGPDDLDGVIIGGMKHEAYVAIGAGRRTQVPTIVVAQQDDVDWHRTATLGPRIAARCQGASFIVAATPQLSDALKAVQFPVDRIGVVPRAVAATPLCSARSREDGRAALVTANYDLLTTGKAYVALAVGRLDADHRFGDLVRAWRIVTARHPEARLWIAGDGPDREALYKQIGDLDQRFRAVLPGTFDCLDELLQASDVLLIPGEHSVPPMVMLQAQVCGVPVIAADKSAASADVAHEQTGLVYRTGDVKALADCVTSLIERPGRAVAYATAARAAALLRATPQDEAQAYVQLIRRSPATR
jgi:glycosyltransferase involved in cell wall biosynthesis